MELACEDKDEGYGPLWQGISNHVERVYGVLMDAIPISTRQLLQIQASKRVQDSPDACMF